MLLSGRGADRFQMLSEADISTYLNLMNYLEHDFPDVKFVYMTGHLDGSGLNRKPAPQK